VTAQDPTHPQYRADIDGLRAVAVLAVVGYHAFPDWCRGGFVGVDVFFVISGYLISTIIMRGLQQHRFLLHEFYARRVRRIFPALALVLAASFALGWFTLLPHEYAQLGKHVAGGAGFISNFVLWAEAGYFDGAAELKPLLHLWSLGVEEQYYILWPLLLFLAWRRRFGVLGLTLSILVGSFALNVAVVGTDPVAAFYSPATRFWELMVGSSLAYVALARPNIIDSTAGTWRNAAAFSGAALIVVAVLGLHARMAFSGYWAALPTLGALLIIAAGPEAWINRQLLAHPAAVFIGLISYPLYLWHWPSLSFVRILALGENNVPTRLGAIAASIVAAWLTYRLLERPIRFGAHGGLKVFALAAVMTCIGSVS
jgi:peptidoglycan/LPS O-acetylase OafA/YrhL